VRALRTALAAASLSGISARGGGERVVVLEVVWNELDGDAVAARPRAIASGDH
jgi:hypothetical protein